MVTGNCPLCLGPYFIAGEKKMVVQKQMLRICHCAEWCISLVLTRQRICVAAITIALSELLWFTYAPQERVTDAIRSLCYGYGFGYLDIVPYLFFLIVNGIPVYFLSIMLCDYMESGHSFAAIRMENNFNFLRSAEITAVACVLLYMILYVSAGVVLSGSMNIILHRGSIYAHKAPFSSMGDTVLSLLLSLTARFWEILMLLSLETCIAVMTKKSVLAFLLTTGLYLPLLFDWCGRFYPIGMSSLLRLVQLGENIEFAAFMVCGLYAVIIAICHRILKRHIWRIHEVGR